MVAATLGVPHPGPKQTLSLPDRIGLTLGSRDFHFDGSESHLSHVYLWDPDPAPVSLECSLEKVFLLLSKLVYDYLKWVKQDDLLAYIMQTPVRLCFRRRGTRTL